MENSKIIQAAEILYRSRIELKRVKAFPKNSTPQTKEDGYAIQEQLSNRYLLTDQKNSIIGKKIGCTSKAAQDQLNVKEPFFGNIFSNNVSVSNSIIEAKDYFSPFVEPEFSFIINKELDILEAPYSSDSVYDSIAAVLPSIEMVDSRYVDWTKAGINNLIADNAVHAHWIYGIEFQNINLFDFYNHKVKLLINDTIIAEGNASNVLDNPINSLTWLINYLALQGKTLPKNSYVSTGTCTPAIPITKGDSICADFGKMGKVNFTYI